MIKNLFNMTRNELIAIVNKTNEQNADLRAVLHDAYSAITTLPTDAMGWSYTDDQKRFSLRNDLLRKINKELAKAKEE